MLLPGPRLLDVAYRKQPSFLAERKGIDVFRSCFLIFSFIAYLGRPVFGDRPLVVYKSSANLVGHRSTRKL